MTIIGYFSYLLGEIKKKMQFSLRILSSIFFKLFHLFGFDLIHGIDKV